MVGGVVNDYICDKYLNVVDILTFQAARELLENKYSCLVHTHRVLQILDSTGLKFDK